MILDRKLRRDLIQSKGLILAVCSIMAVGTGSFVGMLATYNNLNTAKTSYYSECRMADFWVDLKKAPNSVLESVNDIKGISELRPRIVSEVMVDIEGVNKPISGKVISMPETRDPVINNFVMQRGSYFTSERRNEVIISEKFAKARDISPGRYIHLIMNGQKEKMFVVGTAISAEFIYNAPPGGIVDMPKEYGIFYVKQDYAEDEFGFNGAFNNLVGMLTPEARKNPEPVLHAITRKLNDYGVFTALPRSLQFSNQTLSSEMSGLQTMATMFPILFLGVAALILNVLMTRMAEQQRTIVGTLKALGYRNRQLFVHFFKFGLVTGLGGGVGGCVLGYWISGGMNMMYKQVFEFPKLVNAAYPGLMLTSVFISLFFAILGTWRGVKQVARLNPAEAMRAPPPASGGKIMLERWQFFWNNLDFRWQMIVRGFFRNKGRTAVGLFAAAMGSAMVVVAFGFIDSMNAMITFQFDKVMNSDYNIALKDEVDYGAFYEAQKFPGIAHVEPVLSVPCTFINKNYSKKGAITGIIPDAQLTVPRQADSTIVYPPPVGLVMTKRLAEHLHVKKGDMITFVPVKGLKKRITVPIANTIESMIGLSVYADYDYLNSLVNENGAISELQLKAEQTPEQKAAFLLELKAYPSLQSAGEVALQKGKITQQFDGSMQSMAIVMILFAGVIFCGSILNASLISIAERQREIATFRVLGYQPREIGAIFLRENLVINTIGAFIGLPLGYLLVVGMMSQFTCDAYTMPSFVATASYIKTIILSLIFVLMSYWVIRRNILKLKWEEALSMKE